MTLEHRRLTTTPFNLFLCCFKICCDQNHHCGIMELLAYHDTIAILDLSGLERVSKYSPELLKIEVQDYIEVK